jgi:hypothetical protein
MLPLSARGRLLSSGNQTTSFFFVSGFGSGAYSAKLLAETRQRLGGGAGIPCKCQGPQDGIEEPDTSKVIAEPDSSL